MVQSGNLLVDDAYSIKLSDFGLARVKAYTATMTGNCGTYQWMAPEVLANSRYTEKADGVCWLAGAEDRAGVPHAVVSRFDPASVYSFGVVCWELFTSRCPYESMNQIQVAMAVLNEGKRLAIPDSTPSEVAAVVHSCWHAEPSSRPSFLNVRACSAWSGHHLSLLAHLCVCARVPAGPDTGHVGSLVGARECTVAMPCASWQEFGEPTSRKTVKLWDCSHYVPQRAQPMLSEPRLATQRAGAHATNTRPHTTN